MEKSRSTAKDVFSHLLAIVTLYMGVTSFIALYFQYINVKFPDILNFYYTSALDTIRLSMSVLIIAWPVFILISWMIYKDMKSEPAKTNIAIRKWLLYLTLFIASITIIVDLITLVNYFLNGEITTRFILKVIVVLLVAAAVFAYYLWDLRRDVTNKTVMARNVAIITAVVALATIVLGFVFVGSPAEQRAVRLDAQRVSDLSSIQNEAINYFSLKRELPATLNVLTNSISGFTVPVDPSTKAAYEYNLKSDLEFELCATFDRVSAEGQNTSYPIYYDSGPYGQNWNHEAGRVCFSRTIDPALYPAPTIVK
ncbi:MAG: DUF5671 domain-containing protein [Patescibacteria group bacterium]|jgi:hypothetical protein